MAEFCDVALPVPLDAVFTYRIPEGMQPVSGGRVLVPFRQQRLPGVVVELHDRKPAVKTVIKDLASVQDPAPVLDEQLLRLGKWISDYYLAPLGEVFRTMLPLGAEFKRVIAYRITKEGHLALHLAGMAGSSARARNTPEDQLAEFRALEYLAEDPAPEQTLRTATRISRAVLAGMVRKKWIAREDVSRVRDAARTVKVAMLKSAEGKLNVNQQTLVETMAAAGGKVAIEALRSLDVPHTTLSTLVKRGMVEIIDEPAEFTMSTFKARTSPFEFQFSLPQQEALRQIEKSMNARNFVGCCCTASPDRARPPFISRPCALCSKPDARPSCSSRKSASRPRSRRICTRCSAKRLPFCIPHSPTTNAPSNGTASSVERRGW